MNKNSEKEKGIPELSVVILCYQEGRRIESFVQRTVKVLERLGIPWEIVLVANYWDEQQDETPRVAEKISRQSSHIKTVAGLKKGGMGWDARQGFRNAAGRFICLIDGDGQISPEHIIPVYHKIKREPLDVVLTYRRQRGDSWLRKINSYVYNLVFRILFPAIPARDANSKPKIFTREAYSRMHLTADDWFLDAEMLIQAVRMKMKIAEIPVIFDKCIGRKSYVKIDAIFEFMKNLLRARIKEYFTKK
ncbi:MAG TPA: glycosyltransferase [Smithella sp.]|nr:glycosyltransferase [Smithella sp.]HOG89724.1 glycosyltransferase [Smithella sp.]